MVSYDKAEIKDKLTLENIYDLLDEWGGEPEYTNFGIISATICHNPPGVGSHKLYFYENSKLFHCYTGCDEPSFDIFQLFINVASIQFHKEIDLNAAVRYLAQKFNIICYVDDDNNEDASSLEDWEIFMRYDNLQETEAKDYSVNLSEYDDTILDRFNYKVRILPWENDGISRAAMKRARIGFFPGADQITIPHYDKNGRLVGIRGRALCQEDAEKYGKYRPLRINRLTYSHPLGMNLYNLNNSKKAIGIIKKAIVFEGKR